MSEVLSRKAYQQYKCFGRVSDYPKSTEEAASELRTRGCDATVPALNYLIKQGRIKPKRQGRNYEWSASNIDQAASHFEEQEALTPQAHALQWLGIDADIYFEALYEAWIKLGDEFGEAAVPLPPNPDFFVSHFYPPRMAHPGRVEFTLCDDSREQLELLSAANRGVKPLVSLKNSRRRKPSASRD
jgi:hypothetical protein